MGALTYCPKRHTLLQNKTRCHYLIVIWALPTRVIKRKKKIMMVIALTKLLPAVCNQLHRYHVCQRTVSISQITKNVPTKFVNPAIFNDFGEEKCFNLCQGINIMLRKGSNEQTKKIVEFSTKGGETPLSLDPGPKVVSNL